MYKTAQERVKIAYKYMIIECFGGLAVPKYAGSAASLDKAKAMALAQANNYPGTAFDIVQFVGTVVVPPIKDNFFAAGPAGNNGTDVDEDDDYDN